MTVYYLHKNFQKLHVSHHELYMFMNSRAHPKLNCKRLILVAQVSKWQLSEMSDPVLCGKPTSESSNSSLEIRGPNSTPESQALVR